ncbi:hypothetical protein GCM10027446_33700 [Angustibacter peucedani]
MTTTSTTAPPAPARLGEAAAPAAMLRYLADLGAWRDSRRSELDALDQAALAAPDAASLTDDVALSMALWQAVSTRLVELEKVWDSGRVGRVELLQLSSLVWGRLDTAAAGAPTTAASLAVSVPEACRLSDALTGQLRQRLSLDPVGTDLAAHLRSLRATVERIRDLVPVEPYGATRDAAAQRLQRLDRRVDDLAARAQRGADVAGLVGPLEADAAVCERDLIVAAATRRADERDLRLAHETRVRPVRRAGGASHVVDRCVAEVVDAPRLAVPRVEALGEVPAEAAAVDAYLARLADVERALAVAEQAYSAPLAERDELTARLDAYRAKASGLGRAQDEEVVVMHQQAAKLLAAVPTDLSRARAAVAAYQTLLGSPASDPTPGRPA